MLHCGRLFVVVAGFCSACCWGIGDGEGVEYVWINYNNSKTIWYLKLITSHLHLFVSPECSTARFKSLDSVSSVGNNVERSIGIVSIKILSNFQ